MNYKQTFINWISESKLKNITPMDLANNIESSFSICLNYDVWQIRDPKTYSELRNKIILDRTYKKKNKKAYKLFVSQSKYFQTFLKMKFISETEKQYSNENNAMEQTIESTFDSTIDTTKVENKVQSISHNQKENEFSLNNDEVLVLYEFFNKDYVTSHNFYLILKFALENNNELILDIRTTIAGVKVDGERLRFYSDKNGFLRFSKINKSYNLNEKSLNLELIFDSICETNKYFEEHPNEVKLIAVKEKEPLGYVFHKTFGFGMVKSREDGILTVKFDNQDNPKKITDQHPSFEEIDKKTYEYKIEPSYKKEEMSSVRINWDKYEVALLIEAYWKIECKQGNRADILNQLSRDLRTRAQNNGIKIDATFRNFNGMSFQLSALATSFNPKKYLMHKTFIFDEMANLYLNDRKEFEKILNEAHKQIDIGHDKKVEKPSSILVSDVQTKSAHSKKIETLLFLTPEERLNAYPDYLKVLNNGFENGFAYQNMLRKKKFVRLYEELNGKDFSDTDEQYKEKLFVIGFESEDKIYLPTMVSSTLCDSIKAFIDNSLNGASQAIYYSVIYDNFSDRLSTDFSEDMIKKYLVYMFVDHYKFEKEYLTKKGISVDLKQELIDMFNSVGSPMEINDIYSRLPNMDKGIIDDLLKDKDFVVNFRGKSYFYKNIFAISGEQIEEIKIYINEMIRDKDQVSGTELYNFIVEQLPELIELNPEITDLGFKNILKLVLADEFSFKGDVISASDKKIDVKELYKEFGRQREKFTLEELESFRDSIHKAYIDYNAVFDVAIRVDANTYVRRDLIEFDIEAIDEAILSYCSGKYISYLDIINFTEFPTIGFSWNYYVLEGFLYFCSKKFSLLCSAYNKEKPVGAIVKKGAYNNFEEVIVDVIKDNKLFDKEKAFGYLQENDFILTKKFKNIDLLINKAKK